MRTLKSMPIDPTLHHLLLNTHRNNPRKFWKLLSSAKSMDDTNTPINPQALLNHFKTLNETNITPNLTNIPNISLPYVPELDDEITYDEVKQAINHQELMPFQQKSTKH